MWVYMAQGYLQRAETASRYKAARSLLWDQVPLCKCATYLLVVLATQCSAPPIQEILPLCIYTARTAARTVSAFSAPDHLCLFCLEFR